MSKIYRLLTIGPIGSGKSRLCNFIFRKNIFAQNEGCCSVGPEIFLTKRNGLNIEIIDYEGYEYKIRDKDNFKKILNILIEKNSLDLFLLVFDSIYLRFHSDTKNYLEIILNTFTPTEFLNHLAIVFTDCELFRFSKKIIVKNIDIITMQLNQFLEEIVGIKNNPNIIPPKIYEIDTELDENEKYNDKYQATIDVLLLNMEKNFEICGEISTKDLKLDGVKERLEKEEIKFKQINNENREIKIKEIIDKYNINIRTFS